LGRGECNDGGTISGNHPVGGVENKTGRGFLVAIGKRIQNAHKELRVTALHRGEMAGVHMEREDKPINVKKFVTRRV